MIAIAIGPQNTLRVSGTIASTVARAVRMTGRVRWIAASSTAFQGSRPSAISVRTWSIRISELRMIIPPRAMIPLTRSVFWGPMAIAIMGGLTAATVLTILFVPALYAAWFRISRQPRPDPVPPLAAQPALAS